MKLFTDNYNPPYIDLESDPNTLRMYTATQVHLLRKAYLSPEGWKDIIDDKDEQDVCSLFQIFKVQQKVKYLYTTLACALKHFDVTTNNFLDICSPSLQKVNDNDSYYSKEPVLVTGSSERTVASLTLQDIFQTGDTYQDYCIITFQDRWCNDNNDIVSV